MTVEAVLFDVDFTLARPGPEFGPEGYRRAAGRHGLDLDPVRYEEARQLALADLRRHPEFEHDEEIWVAFTERILRGMGAEGEPAQLHACAVEIEKAWERAEHFDLYDDVPAVLAELRGHGIKLGLVSNGARDLEEFVAHHKLEVDVAVGSRSHGKVKPDPSIFRAALERLGVAPEAAVMVGDSPEDDVEGARALGMRAFLVDREGRHPEWEDRLPDLRALPAALGLAPSD